MIDLDSLEGEPSDIVALLERTTPDALAPLDLSSVARHGRRRRRRQRSAVGAAAVAVVAVLAVVAVQPWASDSSGDLTDAGIAGPNGEPLTDPAGSWTQLPDPPFAPRSDAFGGTLSDGRVLVWGGQTQEDGPMTARVDGAIYDPETGEWASMAEAPSSIQPATEGGMPTYYLVDDRLAVTWSLTSDGGPTAGAVYDVAENRWHEVPIDESHIGDTVVTDAAAWDGETLVTVELDPETGDPVTLRWTLGESQWQTGAPPPLSWRYGAGAAADGDRLAIWGGSTTRDATEGEAQPGLADGAIYDVAANTWQMLPDGPLPGRARPAMVWDGNRVVVGGGAATITDETQLDDLAAYNLSTGEWTPLPSAPQPEGADAPLSVYEGTRQVHDGYVAGATRFVVTDVSEPQSGPIPVWALMGDRWELAPLQYADRIGDFVVASSGGGTIGPDNPFAVQVRIGPDEWIAAAEAPFGDLQGATAVVTGSQLIVVGGHDMDDWTEPGDAWVFDLAG